MPRTAALGWRSSRRVMSIMHPQFHLEQAGPECSALCHETASASRSSAFLWLRKVRMALRYKTFRDVETRSRVISRAGLGSRCSPLVIGFAADLICTFALADGFPYRLRAGMERRACPAGCGGSLKDGAILGAPGREHGVPLFSRRSRARRAVVRAQRACRWSRSPFRPRAAV